ncbi:imidazoleglycerol-phosphate dehydratase HisB [Helicobacter mustelae]|uniref:Imidazoleglycerol-phosphate dehydratase n=1 Tax=Helicobacter mustelae (strain ATCC 43772 / CCUG 25715 / CIP 103759 / LMG 18044 / NCTC 12198 / R85-136P) TaxID=679897 RepID=D3UIT4_HELM1|nr:imidazoleglycerol-phosphate dehydratase HisB [Helicobacter mustelae]CBG40409.1 imidazoleglycerol-phosphate dehydratase [Helicobacter mustelae 12198]SQH71909.1 imidazoleglycerol-phosphate dehydratase [Helicobacter mustelae]STP13049.1 imidazoleglycerol-phosphate dehydratase [Helicobacter mustelae]
MKYLERNTKETKIKAGLRIYGSGQARIATDIAFFDHMLEALAKHSLMDLELQCIGDLGVDYHHSIEDCGIVIGTLLGECLYPLSGVERFGNASVVMDEACVECDLDLSNRAFLHFDLARKNLGEQILQGNIRDFNVELIEEFFRALAMQSRISMHLALKRGHNLHHIIEAGFKAFALALRRAMSKNERILIPSTKGAL